MNGGAADLLRERLASALRLDELFLFGSYRLFAPESQDARDRRRAQSPTVESLILIATKGPARPGHSVRVTALEDERAAAASLHPGEGLGVPERDALLAELTRRADAGRGGRRGGIFVHSVRQDALRHSEPWPVKFGAGDLAAQVVAHLDRVLARDDDVEPLGLSLKIVRGIETGADGFKGRIQRRMSRDDLDILAAAGRRDGDPILELPPGSERRPPWRDHPELLARSVEPHAILYGALDEQNYASLVWIGRGDEVPQVVQDALEPWKRVLATRAEFARNSRRRWFETAWPRDKQQMRSPKVIALYRTDRGRFAVDEDGSWQPSNKTTLCTAKHDGLSVVYLCGLLNAELLDLWYAVRGKTPWHVRRNYEPKPMARIPYRQVDLIAAPSDRAAALAAAGDHPARLAICDDILATPKTDSELGHALEAIVRSLAANRSALLPLRGAASALTATVKDPWRIDPPEIDEAALLATLPAADTISVRLDGKLAASVTGEGVLGRPTLNADGLRFRHGRQVTATVTGRQGRLELLARLLGGRRRMLAADLVSVLLPKDQAAFSAEVGRRADEIDALLEAGRDLVERAERLVCRLYRVSNELEDEVVASAIARAARAAPQDGD